MPQGHNANNSGKNGTSGPKSATKELDDLKGRVLIESEKDVIELIVAAAKKIVHREISADKELVAHRRTPGLRKPLGCGVASN